MISDCFYYLDWSGNGYESCACGSEKVKYLEVKKVTAITNLFQQCINISSTFNFGTWKMV